MHQFFRESDNRYRFQMTLDRDTFLRALPGAVGFVPFDQAEQADNLLITSGNPAPGWALELRPLPPLRLGALALPRLEVVLDLAGQSATEAEAFANRFLSHFQRAGG